MSSVLREIGKWLENMFNLLKGGVDEQKETKKKVDKLESLVFELKNENKQIKEILNNLIENFEEKLSFKKESEEFREKLSICEREKEDLKKNHFDLEEKLKECLNKNENLENVLKVKEEKLEKVTFELDTCQERINSLKEKEKELNEINQIIKNEKLMKLLKAILKNPALETFREKNNIKDEDYQSIYNLLTLLGEVERFVNRWYKDVEEYKKTYQDEMSDEEIEFYKAVNEYFNKEVVKDLDKRKIEEEFDKSKHRGINGEIRGETDGVVLIPAILDKKMRVRLK